MAQPNFTEWANDPGPNGIVEPSTERKEVGWTAGEKPPAEFMNWIQNLEYLWQEYTVNKTVNIDRAWLQSAGTATWNGSTGDLVISASLNIWFRVNTILQRNLFSAATLNLADGQVVVVRRNLDTSPTTLSAGSYGTLAEGEYAIVNEASLTANDQENELIVFRRNGSNLEIPLNGFIFPTGSTINFGESYTTNSSITIAASQVTSGTFDNARISQGNVTQHQAALAIASTQLTYSGLTTSHVLQATSATTAAFQALTGLPASAISSGTFDNARISQGNVTQHQAALAIDASQIGSGTLPATRGGTGVNAATGSGSSVVLSTSPTITGLNLQANPSGYVDLATNAGSSVFRQYQFTGTVANLSSANIDFQASSGGTVQCIAFVTIYNVSSTESGGWVVIGGMTNNAADHSITTYASDFGTPGGIAFTSPGSDVLRMAISNTTGGTATYSVLAFVTLT